MDLQTIYLLFVSKYCVFFVYVRMGGWFTEVMGVVAPVCVGGVTWAWARAAWWASSRGVTLDETGFR